jgi:hypothetical protein
MEHQQLSGSLLEFSASNAPKNLPETIGKSTISLKTLALIDTQMEELVWMHRAQVIENASVRFFRRPKFFDFCSET